MLLRLDGLTPVTIDPVSLHDVSAIRSPWQRARCDFIESFNGRLRDECLNDTLFSSLRHATAILAAWKQDYNYIRPHSAHGGKTPSEFAAQSEYTLTAQPN